MFDSLIKQLNRSDQDFATVLDRLIKFIVNLINTTEELQEELIAKDLLIQFNIIDVKFNFWIKFDKGKISYKKGISEKATLIANINKKQVIKIINGELSAIDDFMKGKIKATGNLGHGLLFIKIFRLIVKYTNQKS